MRAPEIVCLVSVSALIIFSSCQRSPQPDAPAAPPQTEATQDSLKKLHHAAEEMALDGFQFDKPELGWPHDVGAKTGAQFLSLLRSHTDVATFPHEAEVQVANVAETDPLDTALFKFRDASGNETVIRKDGQFAPSASPPRYPQWLP